MVVGDLIQIAIAQQIAAAIPHVPDNQVRISRQRQDAGGSHALLFIHALSLLPHRGVGGFQARRDQLFQRGRGQSVGVVNAARIASVTI